MWRRRSVRPQPPLNVRIEYPDGTVVPIEVVYAGIDKGVHLWRATGQVTPVPGLQLLADEIPPFTAIEFPVDDG